MRVLVVAAHPDDEVLGAGATIARHVSAGDEVTIAILGQGLEARMSSPDELDPSDTATLRTDAQEASRILGCDDLRLFDLPDNRFDSVPLLDVVKTVESVVRDVDPELVYTHFDGDLNIDHTITARAVLTACRPVPGSRVRRLLSFEVPSATGWGSPERPFSPTVFIDAAETLSLKLDAMDAYQSEVRPYPHPRSREALAARAKAWGSMAGLDSAEPFILLREVQSG